MTYQTIDYALRCAAVAIILQCALLFLRARRTLPSLMGAAFLLSAAAEVFGDLVWADAPIYVRLTGAGLQSLTVPTFWLFARSWFDDAFRLRLRHMVFVGMFAVAFAIGSIPLADEGLQRGSDVVRSIVATVLAAHAVWMVWSGREQDLIEGRRMLRVRFVAMVALLMVWWLWSNTLALHFEPDHPLTLVNELLVITVVLFLTDMLFGLRDDDVFAGRRDGAGANHAPAEGGSDRAGAPPVAVSLPAHLVLRLERIMGEDRLYRNADLTIGSLAARLEIQDYRLRAHVNGVLGHRNFREYLNGLRLVEVREALGDPAQAEVSILTIAMDAGFGSLPAFNRAFKAEFDETPTEFRRRRLDAASKA